MNNLKSSFWGNISYIGMNGGKASSPLVSIRIASHDMCIASNDKALPFLRVTAGSTKHLIIFEQIDVVSNLYRVYAVWVSADRRTAMAVQEVLREAASSLEIYTKTNRDGTTGLDECIADWAPDYQLNKK